MGRLLAAIFLAGALPAVAQTQAPRVGPIDHREIPNAPLLGGSAGSQFVAIAPGVGLSLSGSSLGVLYGTATGTALQGSLRGAANGVASLDGFSLVPLAQIPVIPATQTSGFAAVATSGSASDLGTGTLPAARLPTPTALTLGGVQSFAGASHQFLTGVSLLGVPQSAQPAAADISGLAPSATVDTTNAANISSGTLPAARLPNPSATTLGGVESLTGQAHQFLTGISTLGVPQAAQPAFTDISGNPSSAQVTGGLGYTPLAPANNLSDLLSAATARTNLGLGSIATQSAGSIAITGGAIDGTALGGATPAAGAFSTLTSNTSLIVPNLASTPVTTGSIAYNTGTGRYDFGIGASVVNHVRLSGDTMTGALHMGANLLDGSNVSLTGGTLSGITLGGTIAGTATLSGAITIPSPGAIGATAPNTGKFTALSSTGNTTVGSTAGNLVIQDGSAHSSSAVLSFATEALLKSFQPTNVGTNMITARTAGFTAAGDGGNATYVWNPNYVGCTGPSFPYCIAPASPWVGNGAWVLQPDPGGINVRIGGAKCDAITIAASAVVINSGSPNLSVAGATFTSADVGKWIFVPGAGSGGYSLRTTILTVTDATDVVLAANAVTSVNTSETVMYGTDDTVNINAIFSRLNTVLGASKVVIPPPGGAIGPAGCLIASGNLSVTGGTIFSGQTSFAQATQANPKAYNATILINPAFSVALGANVSLRDITISRAGLPQVPPNMEYLVAEVARWNGETSTGLTIAAGDTVENVRVIGFNIAASVNTGSGIYVRNLQLDGANGFDEFATNAPNQFENIQLNQSWSTGIGARFSAVVATPVSGSGFTTNDVVTSTDGTCTSPVKLQLTVSAGVVTTATPTDVGDCTVEATGNSWSGGTGTGLHVTLAWVGSGWRPGIGINVRGGNVGDRYIAGLVEAYQTGFRISNSSSILVEGYTIEGAATQSGGVATIGFDTENCATTTVIRPLFTASDTNMKLYAKSNPGNSGGTCTEGGNVNLSGGHTIIGGQANGAKTTLNVDLGPSSGGTIDGLTLLGSQSKPAVVNAQAGARWTLQNLVLDPTTIANPWITANATAVLNISGGHVENTSSTLASIGYVTQLLGPFPTSCTGLPTGAIFSSTGTPAFCP